MSDEKFVPMGTKVSPEAAKVWDAICEARQTDTYHMLQNFIYTMIRAAADPHAINPDIRKILTMLDTDASWQHAFNSVSPNVKTKVAQVILILEQENRKGFGAVMIDKPFLGTAMMTECVDDILERVCEVCMRGIYRRLRKMGADLDCNNLSDVLLTMLDMQDLSNAIDSDRQEGPQMGEHNTFGKHYAYGKRTKAKHHRTPDSLAADKRIQHIVFDEYDRTTTDEPDKPYGEKADEYLRNLEERARKEAEDIEQAIGSKPFDIEP